LAKRPNFGFQKRQKEIKRKQKKDEKRERKRMKKEGAEGGAPIEAMPDQDGQGASIDDEAPDPVAGSGGSA
jgi:hypothetical protein